MYATFSTQKILEQQIHDNIQYKRLLYELEYQADYIKAYERGLDRLMKAKRDTGNVQPRVNLDEMAAIGDSVYTHAIQLNHVNHAIRVANMTDKAQMKYTKGLVIWNFVLVAMGLWMTFTGYRSWQKKIQIHQDAILKRQAEGENKSGN